MNLQNEEQRDDEGKTNKARKNDIIAQILGAFEYLQKIHTLLISLSLLLAGYWVADSVDRASLVSDNIDQLVKQEKNRDIALIALDTAIPPPPHSFVGIFSVKEKCIFGIGEGCYDSVYEIARTLYVANKIESLGSCKGKENPYEFYEIRNTVFRRKPKSAADRLLNLDTIAQQYSKDCQSQTSTSGQATSTDQPPQLKNSKALKLPTTVYIHYKNDRDFAENLRLELERMGVSAPGVERIEGISINDIRYSTANAKSLAENLQEIIQPYMKHKDSSGADFKLIDLSQIGYQTPSGLVEIWLKY